MPLKIDVIAMEQRLEKPWRLLQPALNYKNVFK